MSQTQETPPAEIHTPQTNPKTTILLISAMAAAIAIGFYAVNKPQQQAPTTIAAEPRIATDPNFPEIEGRLLPGFPDIAMYPDAQLLGSSYTALPPEANKGFRAKLHTHDPVEEIISWYLDELPESGWIVEEPNDRTAASEQIIWITKAPWTGFIAAENEGSINEIVIDLKKTQ